MSMESELFDLMSSQKIAAPRKKEKRPKAKVIDGHLFCRRGHPKNAQNTRLERKRVRGKVYTVRECRVCCRLLFNTKYRSSAEFREQESLRSAIRYVRKHYSGD